MNTRSEVQQGSPARTGGTLEPHPPPPPTRMAPAPPPHTCQIGQSLERHLLVLVQEHLDLPQADPQVRLVEFVWDVPTCARRRGVRGCRAGRSVVALGGGTGGEFSAGSDQGPCSPVLSSTRPTVSFTANNGREDASTPKAMPCGLPVWRGRCHHPGVRGMRITRPGGTPGNARSSRNNTAASLESGVYDGAAGTKPAPGSPLFVVTGEARWLASKKLPLEFPRVRRPVPSRAGKWHDCVTWAGARSRAWDLCPAGTFRFLLNVHVQTKNVAQ